MNRALFMLGGLLVVDIFVVIYFNVIRHEYYYPERYEDAFAVTFYAILAGIPIVGAFLTALIIKSRKSK